MTDFTNYQKHAAFNLATGEIILTARRCGLNRLIRHNEAWDRAHGYYVKSEWVFAHGDNAYEKICEKARNLLAKRGGAR